MSANATIEFTFESPCPGQLDPIAALEVEGDAAPRAATTRAHLAACPRCRAFRDALKIQGSVARRWFQQTRHAADPDTTFQRDITSWLNDAVKVRSDRELAIDLWRCAAALYRLDPEADRQTVFDDEVGRMSPEKAVERYVVPVPLNERTRFRSVARTRPESRFSISRALAGDRTERLAQVDFLLCVAHSIARNSLSRATMLRSEIDWHFRNAERSHGLIEQAEREASSNIDRAHALNDLAVWQFSGGDADGATALAMRAISIAPTIVLPRLNAAMWSFAVGANRLARSLIESAIRLVGFQRFRTRWPMHVLRGFVCAIERDLGIDPGDLRGVLIEFERLIGTKSENHHSPMRAN